MTNKDLNEFYHGKVSSDRRLLIEEFLMTSSFGLMEFFTLKREKEDPIVFFAKPSESILRKLQFEVTSKRSGFLFDQKSLLATAALALIVAGAFYIRENNSSEDILADNAPAISIDYTAEFVADGAVL